MLNGRHDIGETNPLNSFEDGTGPGLEPVGGEFQPSFATDYLGGGAHLIFGLKYFFQPSAGVGIDVAGDILRLPARH
jgi:hypothetical protein